MSPRDKDEVMSSLRSNFDTLEEIVCGDTPIENTKKEETGEITSSKITFGYSYDKSRGEFDYPIYQLQNEIILSREDVTSASISLSTSDNKDESEILRIYDEITSIDGLRGTSSAVDSINKIGKLRSGEKVSVNDLYSII